MTGVIRGVPAQDEAPRQARLGQYRRRAL